MIHSHVVLDNDKLFTIDSNTRQIRNEGQKTYLVQNDHNSEIITIECPSVIEGHDMMLCNEVQVHYINVSQNGKEVSKGVYEAQDYALSNNDSTKARFSWLITRNATKYSGKLTFLVRFRCVQAGEVLYQWHTTEHTSIVVLGGMDNGEYIVEEYPDVLEQWRADILEECGDGTVKSVNGVEPDPDGNVTIVTDTYHIGSLPPDDTDSLWIDIEDTDRDITYVHSVNGIYPDKGGNVELDIPKCEVQTVNGIAPDESGNVKIDIPEVPEMPENIVESVNGHKGNVVLTADDVGALSKDTIIPSIEGLASEEYVDNAIGNIDVPEAEQIQADWEQNDNTAKDYIKNRPFYTENIAFFRIEEIDITEDDFIESFVDDYGNYNCYEKVGIINQNIDSVVGKTMSLYITINGKEYKEENIYCEYESISMFTEDYNYYIGFLIETDENGQLFINGIYFEALEEEIKNHNITKIIVKEMKTNAIDNKYLTNTTNIKSYNGELIKEIEILSDERNVDDLTECRLWYRPNENTITAKLPSKFGGVYDAPASVSLTQDHEIGWTYTFNIPDRVILDSNSYMISVVNIIINNKTLGLTLTSGDGVNGTGIYVSDNHAVYTCLYSYPKGASEGTLTLKRVL